MPVVSGKQQYWTGPVLWLPAPSSITLGESLSSLHFRRPQGRVPRFQEAGEGGQGTPAVVKLVLSTRHLCRCFTGTISLVPHNSLFISYTEKLKFGELKNRAGTREWLGEVAFRVPPSSLSGPPIFRWAVPMSSTGHYSHTALPLRLPFTEYLGLTLVREVSQSHTGQDELHHQSSLVPANEIYHGCWVWVLEWRGQGLGSTHSEVKGQHQTRS